MPNKFDPTMRQSVRLPDDLANEAAKLLRAYTSAAAEADVIRNEARKRIEALDDGARRAAFAHWEKIAARLGLDAKATFGTGEWVIDSRFWPEHRTVYLVQKHVAEDDDDRGETLPVPPAVMN